MATFVVYSKHDKEMTIVKYYHSLLETDLGQKIATGTKALVFIGFVPAIYFIGKLITQIA